MKRKWNTFQHTISTHGDTFWSIWDDFIQTSHSNEASIMCLQSSLHLKSVFFYFFSYCTVVNIVKKLVQLPLCHLNFSLPLCWVLLFFFLLRGGCEQFTVMRRVKDWWMSNPKLHLSSKQVKIRLYITYSRVGESDSKSFM